MFLLFNIIEVLSNPGPSSGESEFQSGQFLLLPLFFLAVCHI